MEGQGIINVSEYESIPGMLRRCRIMIAGPSDAMYWVCQSRPGPQIVAQQPSPESNTSGTPRRGRCGRCTRRATNHPPPPANDPCGQRNDMWANYCKGRTCHTYRFQGALAVNHLGQTVGTYLDHNMVQLHAAGNGRFDHIYWRCKGQIFGPDENGLVGVAICNGVNFRPDIRCRSCGSFRDQGAKALNEGQVLIGDYEGMSKIMYYPPTWRIVGTDADEEGEG